MEMKKKKLTSNRVFDKDPIHTFMLCGVDTGVLGEIKGLEYLKL